jgi:hypothetical protein
MHVEGLVAELVIATRLRRVDLKVARVRSPFSSHNVFVFFPILNLALLAINQAMNVDGSVMYYGNYESTNAMLMTPCLAIISA